MFHRCTNALAAFAVMASPLFAQVEGPFQRFEGSADNEARLTQDLIDLFKITQAAGATNGVLHRGTHAKGTCAKATFEVLHSDHFSGSDDEPIEESIKAALKVGLYANPGTYPVDQLRVANGAGVIGSDLARDVHSLSFSVDLGHGRRQDYAMNSHPIFPIPSLSAFVNTVKPGAEFIQASEQALRDGDSREKAAAKGQAAANKFIGSLSEAEQIVSKQVKDNGRLVTAGKVASFRKAKYWSGTAFKHGETAAVKYIVSPCDGVIDTKVPESAGEDHLQQDFSDFVGSVEKPSTAQALVCFHFYLQLLDAEAMATPDGKTLDAWQWVEDPTLDWDAAGAKSYKVAKLTVAKNSIKTPADCDVRGRSISVMVNSLPQHKGLGRINRGRTLVEASSHEHRSK